MAQWRYTRNCLRGLMVIGGCVAMLGAAGCSSDSSSGSKGSASNAAAGGSCSANQSDIKLSVIADLSGPSPTTITAGRAVIAAATTAVHLANTSGGVDCHQLKLIVHDGAGTEAGWTQAVRQAINESPVAITGFGHSGFLGSAVPLIAQAKVPWMSTTPVFAGVAKLPFFYSTQLSNADLGAHAAEVAKRALGGSLQGKRVAFEGASNSATTDEVEAGLKKAVEADGGTVGPDIRDPLAFTEWSSQAVNVVASKADAVVATTADAAMLTMADALKTARYAGQLVSVQSVTDRVFQVINNSPGFSSLREVQFPTAGTPLASAVTAAGASLTDASGSGYFGQEFAAATYLVATLRKCGAKCSADQFPKAVTSVGSFTVPLNGLLGPIKFDNSTVATYPAGMVQLQAGKVAFVPPNLP